MNDFNYYTPTRVVFGKSAEEKVGELVKNEKCSKVLLHYGSGSVKRSGLLARIQEALDAVGIAYVELGGVVRTRTFPLYTKELNWQKRKAWILFLRSEAAA